MLACPLVLRRCKPASVTRVASRHVKREVGQTQRRVNTVVYIPDFLLALQWEGVEESASQGSARTVFWPIFRNRCHFAPFCKDGHMSINNFEIGVVAMLVEDAIVGVAVGAAAHSLPNAVGINA